MIQCLCAFKKLVTTLKDVYNIVSSASGASSSNYSRGGDVTCISMSNDIFSCTSHLCCSVKTLSDKVGGMLCCRGSANKYSRLDAKLEKRMAEFKRGSSGQSNFRCTDSLSVSAFSHIDEDSNGTIDREELKKCLQKLQLHLTAEEIEDLFHSCDMDGSEGIQFNEFIVLLCLIYLLKDPNTTSKIDCPQLEATFDTVIEVFVFLDKNGDGKLNKTEVVKALNEASPREKSPAHVSRNRFKEMDWDKNGKVTFRQFLFAFIHWVGIETDEEISQEQS
ncbi:hypothetical protein ACLB2K_041868 [Fragaria x ananassa]